MTNKRAFRAAIDPYSLSDLTIEFLLAEQGLDANEEYEKCEEFYRAVVKALNQVKMLTKQKDGGSENTFHVDKVSSVMHQYSSEWGFEDELVPEEEEIYFIDRTDEY
jgi:hypothetical protein